LPLATATAAGKAAPGSNTFFIIDDNFARRFSARYDLARL
jgi:hypothetical protein